MSTMGMAIMEPGHMKAPDHMLAHPITMVLLSVVKVQAGMGSIMINNRNRLKMITI